VKNEYHSCCPHNFRQNLRPLTPHPDPLQPRRSLSNFQTNYSERFKMIMTDKNRQIYYVLCFCCKRRRGKNKANFVYINFLESSGILRLIGVFHDVLLHLKCCTNNREIFLTETNFFLDFYKSSTTFYFKAVPKFHMNFKAGTITVLLTM